MKREVFPVLGDDGGYIKSIPWGAAEKMRVGAEKNHGQTLERLAERGGMSWMEIGLASLGLNLHGQKHQ